MIPAEYFYDPDENEARAFEESTPLSELSDDVIAVGASCGIPSHVREFMRRNIPDANIPSEEEIALQEAALIEAQREMFNQRFNESIGADLDAEIVTNGEDIDLTQVPLGIPNTLTDIMRTPQFSQGGKLIRSGRRRLHFVPMDMTNFEEEIVDLVCAANDTLGAYDFEFELDIDFSHVDDHGSRYPVVKVRQGQLVLFDLTLTERLSWSHESLERYLDTPSNATRSHHDEFFKYVKSEDVLVWQVCIALEILSYSSSLTIPRELARSSLGLAAKSNRNHPMPTEFHDLARRIQDSLEAWGEDQADEYYAQQFVNFEKDRRRFNPVVEFGKVQNIDRELEETEKNLASLVLHADKIFDLLDIGIGLRLSVLTKVEDNSGLRALVDIVFDGQMEGSLALTGKGNWVNFELSLDAISEIEETEFFDLSENPYAAQRQFFKDETKRVAPDDQWRIDNARLEIESYERQLRRILQFVDSPLSLAAQCAWFISKHGHSIQPDVEVQVERGKIVSGLYWNLDTRFEQETGNPLDVVDLAACHIEYAKQIYGDIQVTEYHQTSMDD